MSELRVLDHDTLGNLFEMTGGDESFLAELIDTFVDDTAGLLAAMRQGLAEGSAAEVRRAAHSLKSNSATFGAPRLAAISQELEAAARDGDLTGAGDRIAALEAAAFEPGQLDAIAGRGDALGRLARVFQRMAREVRSREELLKQQVRELRIEIDEARQAKRVAEITGSDYFQELRRQADHLRRVVAGQT